LRGFGERLAPGKVVHEIDGVRVLAVVTPSVCAHAYIVSPEGARKLARAILPINAPYDAFLRNIYTHKCLIFETSPWIARLSPDATDSTIGGDRRPKRWSPSLTQTARSAMFRLEYNVLRRLFNLRRFGLSYFTKSDFVKAPG
jgi:GR25 family glycosyltransferase involved in LPS biosynthesis